MKAPSFVWVAAFLLLGASAAQAQEYVYTFQGTLNGGQTDYNKLFGPATLTNGESYTATFVLNTALGTFANGPTNFEYTGGAIVSSSLSIGGYPAVAFNPTSSSYADDNTGSSPAYYSFYSTTSTAAYLSQTFLGTQPNPLTSVGIYALTTGDGNFGIETSGGNIALGLTPTSLTVSEVPLPAAGWLMLSALGGLGFMARKRRGGTLGLSIATA